MTKKQLLLLFTCSAVPWTLAAGIQPILPIYILQFGVSQTVVGYYFASVFAVIAAGTFFAGWLADKLQHRKVMFIIYSLAMCPLFWGMGQARNIWQFAAMHLTAAFLFGAQIALVSILTGLFAGKDERGRVLDVIGMTAGLGAIIGGFSIGPIVDRWGYPVMFSAVALINFIPAFVGIFLKDKKIEPDARGLKVGSKKQLSFSNLFCFAHGPFCRVYHFWNREFGQILGYE